MICFIKYIDSHWSSTKNYTCIWPEAKEIWLGILWKLNLNLQIIVPVLNSGKMRKKKKKKVERKKNLVQNWGERNNVERPNMTVKEERVKSHDFYYIHCGKQLLLSVCECFCVHTHMKEVRYFCLNMYL